MLKGLVTGIGLIASGDQGFEFSQLSGVVVPARIGAQVGLRMAFDFTSSTSWVHSNPPPFVVNWYHGPLPTETTVIVGRTAVANVRLSQPIWGDMPSGFRDVAGVIGAAKYSSFFKSKIVEFTETALDEPRIKSFRSAPSDRVWVNSEGVERWMIEASVMDSRDVEVFEINPGFQDLVLPFSKQAEIIAALGEGKVDNTGRLSIICNEEGITAPSITIYGLGSFRIPVSSLHVPGDSVSHHQFHTCPLRIRFGERGILGRPFLRFAGGVVFDFKTSRIGFRRQQESLILPFQSPQSFIPLFGSPVIRQRAERLDAEVEVIYGSEFVLESLEPVNNCWKFIRIIPLVAGPTDEIFHVVARRAGSGHISNEALGIVFHLISDGSLETELSLSKSLNEFQVCVHERLMSKNLGGSEQDVRSSSCTVS